MVYPPNCTSKHQPQDMGIIAATKRYHRRRFLEVRVSTMSVVDTLREQAKERKMVSGTRKATPLTSWTLPSFWKRRGTTSLLPLSQGE